MALDRAARSCRGQSCTHTCCRGGRTPIKEAADGASAELQEAVGQMDLAPEAMLSARQAPPATTRRRSMHAATTVGDADPSTTSCRTSSNGAAAFPNDGATTGSWPASGACARAGRGGPRALCRGSRGGRHKCGRPRGWRRRPLRCRCRLQASGSRSRHARPKRKASARRTSRPDQTSCRRCCQAATPSTLNDMPMWLPGRSPENTAGGRRRVVRGARERDRRDGVPCPPQHERHVAWARPMMNATATPTSNPSIFSRGGGWHDREPLRAAALELRPDVRQQRLRRQFLEHTMADALGEGPRCGPPLSSQVH